MSQDHITPSVRTPATWKTMAVFALVGPLIGGVIGLLMMILFSGKVTSLADAGSMSFVTLIFGYVFGLLPAALTGLAVAWSLKRSPQASAAGRGAAWGALLSSAVGLQIAWLGEGGGNFAFTIFLLALMGAIAGLVCGWLVRANQR